MQQKAQIGYLLGNIAHGLIGLIGTLVGGWTALQGNAGVEMGNQFAAQFGAQFGGYAGAQINQGAQFDHGIVTGGASSSAGARGMGARAGKRAAGRTSDRKSVV